MFKDVSIIIVNYNTKELTRNCLTSVFEKVKNINFEVFVVDNDSQDNSCEMIEHEFPQVKLIKNKKNYGFAVANNIAIKSSNSKYVFLLNSDTILLNNAPEQFFKFMEKTENHNVGICGGKLYNHNMEYIHSYSSLPSLKNILVKTYFKSSFIEKVINILPSFKPDKEPFYNREVGYITGANMFIRKSVLNEVGLFDEDFFMYFEEVELTYRITYKNYKSMLVADANIVHLGGIIKQNNSNKIMNLIISELKYFEKIVNKSRLKFTIKYFIFFRYILLLDINLDSLARIKVLYQYIFKHKSKLKV